MGKAKSKATGRPSREPRKKPGLFGIKGGNKLHLPNLIDKLTLDLQAAPIHDPDLVGFAVDRQLSRMRKRLELRNPEAATRSIEGFLALNELVSETSVDLPPDVVFHARDFIRHVLERYIKKVDPDSLQETFSYGVLFNRWRYGPKASNGVEGLGTTEKIDQPMTCTKSAEPLIQELRRFDPYFVMFDHQCEVGGIRLIEGSRLSTVLKNEDEERVIAIEPSGNMALQLAGASIIEGALSYAGLDIRSQQPKNQSLARRGSKDGSVCTIDLKKASDCRTRDLVSQLWPREWFAFTEKVRSPITRLPDGRSIELAMTSTMGNGLTFPMMTLEIVSLIYAMRRLAGGPSRFIDWSNTAVFGDDIIVPTHEYDELTKLLSGAGYVINHDKSFREGHFRESCGGDYYKGYNVTPVYIRSIQTIPEIYVVINQIVGWASRHRIPCLRSLTYLKNLLRSKPFFVPEWFPETAGIRTSNVLEYCTGKREFKYLRCIPVKKEYLGNMSMRLSIGGYLEQREDGSFHYNVHPEDYVVYRVDRARMSKNYLDGWDPLLGSLSRSGYASLLVGSM